MMSPIHAALLSSVIVNKGIIKYPYIVSKLTGEKNEEFYIEPKVYEKRAIKEETSELIFEAMEKTIKSGTGKEKF